MQDVAQQAGVALSSASRALNGHPDVSPRLRQRVLETAKQLGYEPDLVAQSLRRGTTMTVGFVLRDISNPLFGEIAKAAEGSLRQAGYSMLLSNSDGDPDVEAQNIDLLRRRKVDGLILSLVSEEHERTLTTLKGLRVPMVLLDRDTEGVEAGAVVTDHYEGMRKAVGDLIARGHRRIALVTGQDSIRPTRERVRGLVDAHREAGLPVLRELLALGSFGEDFARHGTGALFALDGPPTALLAGGAQSTVGALTALAERGLRVGSDVAFIGCDDLPLLRLHAPPISVVARDLARIGHQAAQLFLDMVAGAAPRREVVPTTYVPRGSVFSLATVPEG